MRIVEHARGDAASDRPLDQPGQVAPLGFPFRVAQRPARRADDLEEVGIGEPESDDLPADLPQTLARVEPGTARAAAEALAREITRFPQTCLRNDRRSAYAQNGLSETEAMRFELEVGLESLRQDGTSGAARFAGGAGRHGSFR
jgi:hypothetical protein